MVYSFKRDPLGYLRIVLPTRTELEYFSDFIEDIVSVEEADEYFKYCSRSIEWFFWRIWDSIKHH